MSFAAGMYSLPGPALNTGDTVSATENNTFRNDVATAFNLTWLRNGTAAATADIPMGGYSFTNCAAVGSNGSLLLKVNNGTTAATLDTSGNLGLGVTPSAWGASALKAIQLGGGSLALSSSGAGAGDGSLTWNGYYNGTNWIYAYTGGASNRFRLNESGAAWFQATSGTAGGTISYTQAMTLDASGNLGVGVTSPSYKLDVAGSARITAGGSADTILGYGANYDNYFTSGASGIQVFRNSSGTERARIDSSGNLLVGTTNTSLTAGLGFKFINGGASNSYMGIVSDQSTNANANYHLYSTGAGAYRFYVGMGGTINATSTTITGISDRRLKENIRDLDDGLEKVMALQPRKFDWKEGKGANIKNARGFIAQEFEQVFPDMIEEWLDPAPEGEEPYKAVNANLIPTLVKAIQELKTEFDAYKASHP
jgi:hypothetical protein